MNKKLTDRDRFNQVKELLKEMDLSVEPLMKRPTKEDLCVVRYNYMTSLDSAKQDIFPGERMHSGDPRIDRDADTWSYPDGVEEKIKDDKMYKVWYTCNTASDPADMSCFYRVLYVEEVSPLRREMIIYFKNLLKKLQ